MAANILGRLSIPYLAPTPRHIRDPLRSTAFAGFSQASKAALKLATPPGLPAQYRKPASSLPSARNGLLVCTKSCHPPVDAPHSIENKSDTSAIFLLTLKLEGVQQDRSLTVSKVFPVGAASGAQAESPSTLQNGEGRPVRVYSKALVEKNVKPSRRQDRVPRRWVGLSGWR